ncbi:hypothetical protein CpipJ_CPIJ005753 [Culex quinquefasciatus]|uniref:Uncharacterized protein n=1 Tax=Culex quinquefasciatus TaxID=7176 RepID=B0WEP2_CULQU|nr:hypothetical protein CpipJ_CPIJ005753 [Culex quinquefasciatus]|eukprot:XP_001847176.1 hypothetical protein CpipJ_CPIJ005753 [Culex quinquefasciatus]
MAEGAEGAASPEYVQKNLEESHNLDAVEVHVIKRKAEFASSVETPYIELWRIFSEYTSPSSRPTRLA